MVVAVWGKDVAVVNILVVATDFPPHTGGISTYTLELASAVAANPDVHVTVLAPGTPAQESSCRHCPCAVIRTPSLPIMRTMALAVYLPWLLHRGRFDAVLHTVWPTAVLSYVWYCLFPVPYFVSVHGSEILDDTRTWRRRLKYSLRGWKQASLKKARAIFPGGNYSAQLARELGIDESRIHVLSYGVDPKRFKPKAGSKTRCGHGRLLTVARLDLHKGHDRVLEALSMLKTSGLTPEYLIAGHGDEEERLRQMARALGLEEQVRFAGFVADEKLPDIYADSDVFVMASREIPGRLDLIEGFGISFLEASASGIPVIGGRSGGVSDAVRDGETGILVDPNNAAEIADAIRLLLTNRELAVRMGIQGRKWIQDQMTWEIQSKRFCKIAAESL